MSTLKDCLLSGLKSLEPYVEELDDMNVFPISDGDTGRNLSRTLSNIRNMENSDIKDNLILGARGSSGNILSLFFRYWPETLVSSDDIQNLLPDIIQKMERFIPNLQHGTMYDLMISWPKDKGISLTEFFERWLISSEKEILEGPCKLSILDKYGTLDSGAVGLYYILYGISEEIGLKYSMKHFYVKRSRKPLDKSGVRYCVEALIEGFPSDTNLRNNLADMGNSLIFVRDSDVIKLHIHTDDWESVLDACRKNGNIKDWKVDDMRNQND